ncbi:hypothetical protein C8F04DRAFT_1195607 [Mycena alexandri]|uniref:Oxidase ustYa n=1 Tax=Mycena alexandri TaxID=1745969 RepID=A0AAD6S4X8_9AGAR|nr:hypothetical protein C8F04DRAFT_330216 [Mycena alexandri]KAJ7021286.1 hypothetical protein C8F04DRAFT_1195607 [Mycena alexandri]
MKLSSRVLPLATALSCFFNLLLFIKVWRTTTAPKELFNPQEPNFQYAKQPQELPGRFNPTTRVMQHPDSGFAIDDDAKWATIVPHSRGFIRLGSDGIPFSIGIYHQLHCMNTVRFAYRVARDGLFKTAHARDVAFDHANHCFDLLRQTLLCKADTTLLPLASINDTTFTRRCGNPAQIMDFVHNNQAFWNGIPYNTDDALHV